MPFLGNLLYCTGCTLAVLVLFSACVPASAQSDRMLVAVIPDESALDRTALDHQAERLGMALWYSSGSPPATVAEEARLVEAALQRRPAGLLLSPVDAEASAPALRAAKEQGVWIVCVERCVSEPGLADAYLPGPNRAAGELSGDAVLAWMIQKAGSKAVVGVLPCREPGCATRQAAFQSRMRQHPFIDLVAAETNETPSAFLQGHPELNVVWAAGALETRAVLESRAPDAPVLFAGTMDPTLIPAVSNATIQAAAIPLPEQTAQDLLMAVQILAAGAAGSRQPVFAPAAALVSSGEEAQAFLAGTVSLPTPAWLPVEPTIPCNCNPTAHPNLPTPP